MRGWVELHSLDPLNRLPTDWEDTERIASLNSCSRFWQRQLGSWAPLSLQQGGGLLSSRWLQWTHHTLPPFWLQLSQTDEPLQQQCIYGACQFQLLSYSGVPQQKYQHTCNLKPNSFPPLNGKTVISSARDPSHLSNPGGSKTDDRLDFWSALLTTLFIAECLGKRLALYLQDKPCKPLLSILPPQLQEWGIETSVSPWPA